MIKETVVRGVVQNSALKNFAKFEICEILKTTLL